MFADDTKVYQDIKNDLDYCTLQNDLKNLESWSNIWLLKFHPQKCKVLSVGNRNIEKNTYSLCSIDLEQTNREKDIGVIIDDHLSFEEHMNCKINKANSIMGLIRRTFTFLDEQTLLLLYKALVRPHLEYANSVWCPYKVKHIMAIENVQRRATRMIHALKGLSYEERLRKLKLPTLAYRRLRGDMIETFKMTSNIYDPDLPRLLSPVTNSNTRGHSKKLYLERTTKSLPKNFFS